jgi:hypothetical protein
MGKTGTLVRNDGKTAHITVDVSAFDIGIRRYEHTEPMEIEPYHYKLPCFCGTEIHLIPENGRSATCPKEDCQGFAYFSNNRASLELRDG